jgi:hypothetical protein
MSNGYMAPMSNRFHKDGLAEQLMDDIKNFKKEHIWTVWSSSGVASTEIYLEHDPIYDSWLL